MSTYGIDVNISGQVLNVVQRIAIKNSLIKLQLNEHYNDVRFWGKITGINTDYYIIVATVTTTNIQKHFYFSNDDGVTFSKLSDSDEYVASKAPLIRALFSGDIALKYKDPLAKKKLNEDGEEEEEDEEEEQEEEEEYDEDGNKIEKKIDPNARKITELERLSWTVRSIDHDTAIVPRGAVYITPTAEIVKDCTFRGLTVEDSRKIDSYQLYRSPEDSKTLAKNRRMGVNNNSDFLDTIFNSTRSNKDSWTLHIDESGLKVTLRSLVWNGFEYTLTAGTNDYGGAYFGQGLLNTDLLFMV